MGRGRGRPPLDAAVILSQGGTLFFPGSLPPRVMARLNSTTGWLRKRGFRAHRMDNYWKEGVRGVSVYAVPSDALSDGTWGLA